MGLSTTGSNTGLTKKDKIAELKKKHDTLFEKLGVSNPKYIPKMFFGTPLAMPLFKSELKDGKDVYTEKVSKSYESEDETRTLYKWKYNPNWEKSVSEGGYPTKPLMHGEGHMYLIPFSELTPVVEKKKDPVYDFNITDPDSDLPIDQLTIRDLAAILTGKPVSLKPWLNEIVKK